MGILLTVLVILLMGVGFIGVILPVFPGIPFMFVVALIYAFLTNFQNISGGWLVLFAAIALLSLVIDYTSGVIGSKFGGATKQAAIWGFVGSLAGTFVLPVVGTFVGLFLGIVVAEVLQMKALAGAVRAGLAGLTGAIVGTIANVLLGCIFLIAFFVVAF